MPDSSNTVALLMGTRPEAIKLAPLVAALKASPGITPIVISTGQHREMLDQVMRLFGIEPAIDLDIMRPDQSLTDLTARLIKAVSTVLGDLRPSWCVVQGDTTTAFSGALAAFYHRIPIAHVEAGLRTGDLAAPFPEEANRRLVSTIASLHYAPTELSRNNLLKEGIASDRIIVTGNTVIDALLMELERQEQEGIGRAIHDRLALDLGEDWETVPTILVTGHRRENFGHGFGEICDALARLSDRLPDTRIVYPVHLNPRVLGPVHERLGGRDNVRLIAPQGYSEFVALMRSCRLILTDSGGIQEEAPSLGKPVLVMRDSTERPEGIEAGTVALVGANSDKIVAEVEHLLTDNDAYASMARATNPYGDGHAAARIAATLASASLADNTSRPPFVATQKS